MRQIIFAILFVVVLLSPQKTQAFWGEFVQENYHFLLKKIDDTITGIGLGMLKQQALNMLNQQVNKLITGSSTSSVMFITNWENYLVKDPEKKAIIYINDKISQSLRGKTGSNYITSSSTSYKISENQASDFNSYASEGFFSSTAQAASSSNLNLSSSAGNYLTQLEQIAKSHTSEKKDSIVTYEGNPSQMFANGNFKNIEKYLSGINNPWAFDMYAQETYQKKLVEEKKIAETEAIAYQGVKGKKSADGTVINPGSIIKEAIVNVQDLGNKIIAAATHPEEVVSAVVSQMITKAIQQGIGEVQSMVEKEVDNVTSKINSEIGNATGKLGTGILYNNTSSSSSGSTYKIPTATSGGNCYGKKDGDSCTLSNPSSTGSYSGTCSGGLCFPKKQ